VKRPKANRFQLDCVVYGGADGTRTRDLVRDRHAF
jgi:hypothetical protein